MVTKRDYESAILRWSDGHPQYQVYAKHRPGSEIVEVTIYTIVSTRAQRLDFEISTKELDEYPVAELARFTKVVESEIAYLSCGGRYYEHDFVDERLIKKNEGFWL
jgi:hypothetical protein